MPLYSFRCELCGTAFDALVPRPSTAPAADCPACGGAKVTREFGVPARVATGNEVRTNCRGDGPPCGASGCGRDG